MNDDAEKRRTSGEAEGPFTSVQPPTDDASSKYIVSIDGPEGRCFIAWIGGMPEREHAFVYRDKDYHFYFYAQSRWDGKTTYDVDVENATVSKFTGPHPRIRAQDFARIERNIKAFFEERWFMNSSKVRPPEEIFRNLSFSWKVRLV
ncbi:hypothetical protein [Bradyrhizobium sp. CCGUVB14]|uniref:hypothetical protein n=1 Tax=Bradyrhizobium sp. CCGUVB14 TaxID=2949628 RepID=UPI0020B251AB|nr:hypothetical protein [Bradyrhizobium sp. CCGUVB14]MCP3446165.1 hypothetical protein [Bradyrhizobium sp. CCGUVB14]